MAAMLTRFTLDVASERATARLRLLGAVAVVGGCGWIAVTRPGVVVGIVAAFGLLVAAFWVVSWRRSEKRLRDAPRWYLELGADELVLSEGERVVHVPWPSVRGVEIDEERLVVVVTRTGADPVVIEPRYPGVAIEALAAAVRAHLGSEVATAP